MGQVRGPTTEREQDRLVRRRSTRQGAAVDSLLREEAGSFRTAQELHELLRERGETIGLTTVYRHLNALAERGEVDALAHPDGEAVFRLCGPAQDARGHHHHLVCRVCGRSEEVADVEVDAWLERVARSAGYTDTSHTVEVFGLCPEHSTPAAHGSRAEPEAIADHPPVAVAAPTAR